MLILNGQEGCACMWVVDQTYSTRYNASILLPMQLSIVAHRALRCSHSLCRPVRNGTCASSNAFAKRLRLGVSCSTCHSMRKSVADNCEEIYWADRDALVKTPAGGLSLAPQRNMVHMLWSGWCDWASPAWLVTRRRQERNLPARSSGSAHDGGGDACAGGSAHQLRSRPLAYLNWGMCWASLMWHLHHHTPTTACEQTWPCPLVGQVQDVPSVCRCKADRCL